MDENEDPYMAAILAEVAKFSTDLNVDLTDVSNKQVAPHLNSAFINVMGQFPPSEQDDVLNAGLKFTAENHPKVGWPIKFSVTPGMVQSNLGSGLLKAGKIKKSNFDSILNFFQKQIPNIDAVIDKVDDEDKLASIWT
jgi:hypothetical protein